MPIDGGGEPPNTRDMEHRLTVLETKLETVMPTLATKGDLSKLQLAIVTWLIGVGIAVSGLVIGFLNLTKPVLQPLGAQPIVIQMPSPQQSAPPPAAK